MTNFGSEMLSETTGTAVGHPSYNKCESESRVMICSHSFHFVSVGGLLLDVCFFLSKWRFGCWQQADVVLVFLLIEQFRRFSYRIPA